jgi:hypothetical protein
VGLEKRRYLLFASVSAAKGLVSATFFTERERPTGTVMHEKAHCLQWGLNSLLIKSQVEIQEIIQIDFGYNK